MRRVAPTDDASERSICPISVDAVMYSILEMYMSVRMVLLSASCVRRYDLQNELQSEVGLSERRKKRLSR